MSGHGVDGWARCCGFCFQPKRSVGEVFLCGGKRFWKVDILNKDGVPSESLENRCREDPTFGVFLLVSDIF